MFICFALIDLRYLYTLKHTRSSLLSSPPLPPFSQETISTAPTTPSHLISSHPMLESFSRTEMVKIWVGLASLGTYVMTGYELDRAAEGKGKKEGRKEGRKEEKEEKEGREEE